MTCSSPKNRHTYLSRLSNDTNGYVVYTVLIVITLVSILFISLQIAIRTTMQNASSHIQKKQAHFLAESGIERAEFFLNGGDGHSAAWETDSYEEQLNDYGKIVLKCRPFGFFSQINSTGIRRTATDTVNGLAGRKAPKLLSHSFILTSKSGGCALMQNSSIQGTIVLDHGYVTDKPHGNRTLPQYQKQLFTTQCPSLPFDSSEVKSKILKFKSEFEKDLQSKVKISGSYNFVNNQDSLLLQKKIIIDGDCGIDCSINNSAIVARGNVSLSSKAKCRNISVSAQSIITELGCATSHSLFFTTDGISFTGGSHNSQFISTDSIIIKDNTAFGMANCLVSFRYVRKDSSVSGGVYIRSSSDVKGTIISCIDPEYQKIKVQPFGSSITIEPGSTLKGYFITDYDINIKNTKIEGTLWARSVVAFHDSTSYTNALIGVTITQHKEDITFPLLGDLPFQVVVDR